MAEFVMYESYGDGKPPTIPKPEVPPDPTILTVQEGVPTMYPDCHGRSVRVVHPANPKAPAKNMGLVKFYLPPHAKLAPSSHETEETYVILEGTGTMTFAEGKTREVKKGDFVYLRPWCIHGIENTGIETLEILICTSPPNV